MTCVSSLSDNNDVCLVSPSGDNDVERSLTGCPASLRGSGQLSLLGDSLLSAELDSLSDSMGAVGGCDPRTVPSTSQDDQVCYPGCVCRMDTAIYCEVLVVIILIRSQAVFTT